MDKWTQEHDRIEYELDEDNITTRDAKRYHQQVERNKAEYKREFEED